MHDIDFIKLSNIIIIESWGVPYCRTRRHYHHPKAAQDAARKKGIDPYIVYKCPFCNTFHFSPLPTREQYQEYVNRPYTDTYQKESQYGWVCDGKKSFKTQLSANTFIRYRRMENVQAYPCPCCQTWHIGHRYRA